MGEEQDADRVRSYVGIDNPDMAIFRIYPKANFLAAKQRAGENAGDQQDRRPKTGHAGTPKVCFVNLTFIGERDQSEFCCRAKSCC